MRALSSFLLRLFRPVSAVRIWLWLFGLAVLPLPGHAQNGELSLAGLQKSQPGKLTSFLQDAGLVQAKIFDVAFEETGVVWLAASDGLYRYDGYFWQRFSTESGLPGSFVRCVLVTRDQKVWVGTNQGAGIFDGKKYHPVGDVGKMAGPSVRRMVEDTDGTIWFCHDAWPDIRTPSGISAFKDGTWQLYGGRDGLAGVSPLNFFRSSSGEQFAMTMSQTISGVFRKTGERWTRVEEVPDLIWCMSEHPQLGVMALWGPNLAAYKDGIWTFHPCTRQQSLPFTITQSGEILACSRANSGPAYVTRWNGSDFEAVSPPMPPSSGPLENLKEAPDGAVWGVGDNVLFRWSRTEAEWTDFPQLPQPRGLDQEGAIWFTGQDQAVRLKDQTLTRMSLPAGNCLLDRMGSLWSWSDNEVTRVLSVPFGESFTFPVSDVGLRSILGMVIGVEGSAWAYDDEQYSRFDGIRWNTKRLAKAPNARITGAAADPRGGLWFITVEAAGRVTAIHSERGVSCVLDQGAVGYTTKLAADISGGLWIFGIGGLYRMPAGADNWQKIQGLAGDNVLSAVQGAQHMWFVFNGGAGGRSGFGYFDGSQWQQVIAEVTGYTQNPPDGDLIFAGPEALFIVHNETISEVQRLSLPTGVQEVRNIVKDRDGTLWIGAMRGALVSSTWRYRADGIPPAVAIIDSTGEVRHDGRLRVQAAAVEKFQAHQPKAGYRFSTRIDSGPWSAFRETRGADIAVSGLPPAIHHISLRCRDEAGDISPVATTVAFRVLPTPLELRPWFTSAVMATLGVIALLAMIASRQAFKFRMANVRLTAEVIEKQQAQTALQLAHDELETRVEERSRQLEQEISVRQNAEVKFSATLAERNRLGREIHDTLEQSLAGVGMQLNAAKMVFQDSSRAEQHLDLAVSVLHQSQIELRRSVLDLRSQTLEDFDLATALAVAAKQLTDGSTVRVQSHSSGQPRRFSSTMENGLLRIGQEALTNATKHARATLITLELDFQPGSFRMRIIDNGCGFDTRNQLLPDDGHFGLLGMSERAKRLGGELHLTSTPSGTTVEITVPLTVTPPPE